MRLKLELEILQMAILHPRTSNNLNLSCGRTQTSDSIGYERNNNMKCSQEIERTLRKLNPISQLLTDMTQMLRLTHSTYPLKLQ